MGCIALLRMQAEALLKPVSGYHTTPPQPKHNVTPTHIEPDQYIKWHQVGLSLFNYQGDARSNKHKISEHSFCSVNDLIPVILPA